MYATQQNLQRGAAEGNPSNMLVAICIPTYKRPGYLHDLLESMVDLALEDFRACIIVVDNDDAQSSRSVVENAAPRLPVTIDYIAEPTRGIASARNRLVAEAQSRGAGFVSFVDDDQLVQKDWLAQLVRIAIQTDADAVVGRWLPLYEDRVPEWVRRSGCWEQASGPTGSRAQKFGTGNVLIRTSAMLQLPGPFDERLNFAGGSDGHFFVRFHRQGFRSVWCRESVVFERISMSRATATWLVKREFRYGTNSAFVARDIIRSRMYSAMRLVAAVGYMAGNAALTLAALPLGKSHTVPRVCKVARGAGLVAGMFGATHEEYRNTHGS